jgi:hypothetical protein
MKKIFIFIGILIIALYILKSNILKPNKLSENTKESLSELVDLTEKQVDDLSKGISVNEDKHSFKKSYPKSYSPVSRSDKNLSIALPLFKDFRNKDLKASAEHDKEIDGISIDGALSKETIMNSNKINFYISQIDELIKAEVKYFNIYDENVEECMEQLRNTEITEKFILGSEASFKRSRKKMETFINSKIAYYSSIKDILKLANTMVLKDLSRFDGDSFVILDKNYLNKYKVAVEKYKEAKAITEKEGEAFFEYWRNSSKKLKDFVEKN